MLNRIQGYVAVVAASAVGGSAHLPATPFALPARWGVAVACLVGWGLIAQIHRHRISSASSASIASIPYLAGAFLVPSWESIFVIVVAETILGALKRLPPIKWVFNVAQLALAFGLAIFVYRVLGGSALLNASPFRALPYCVAVGTFFCANTLAVSGAVAISEKRNLTTVWRVATRAGLVYDFLSAPLPYFFALVFAAKGVLGAVLLAVPLIAIRQVFLTAWRLEQATQDLLQLMVKAIEARDPYTSGHSQRVEEYSVLIGRAAGLSGRACERLAKAALLHDVGKIHEMYAPILRKPDKLTREEWEIMKTHPIKSAELVSAVSHLRDVVPAIRHHHENWDGSGYPDMLQGEDIPLFSRIIAIADTVDAMTTDRPYRHARSLEQVRLELTRMAGQQFDPRICVALLNGPFFAKLARVIAERTTAKDVSRSAEVLRTA